MDPQRIADGLVQAFNNFRPESALPESLTRILSLFVSGSEFIREVFASHCEMGGTLAQRLGLPENAQLTIRHLWEQWDGKGVVYGLRGPQITHTSRLLRVAQVVEAAYRLGGESTATETVVPRRGKDLDPDMVDAYLEASKRRDFWSPGAPESVQQAVLDIRPRIPNEEATDAQVENVCQVLADFVDIKSPSYWGHSRATAEVAEGIARRLGLGEVAVTRLRRAALVHDLGIATVPCIALEKQTGFSVDEWERLRLHPYYTERILSRVEIFKDLAAIAVAHHEWVDGGGFHRQLKKEHTSLSQRVLALADGYVDLASRQGREKDPESLLRHLEPSVGTQFDLECYQGLVTYLQGAPGVAAPETSSRAGGGDNLLETSADAKSDPSYEAVGSYPQGVTGTSFPKAAPGAMSIRNLSKREIEVLRELAKGLRNREIAQSLVISEKTVERHLENIYNKLGISSRTSAVVYAIQNRLLV